MSPLITSILAIIFLKEKYSHIKLLALLLGFIGAMIIIKPFDADLNLYLILALLSSLFWSISLIFTKQLARNQNAITVAFYFSFMLTPLALILAFPG